MFQDWWDRQKLLKAVILVHIYSLLQPEYVYHNCFTTCKVSDSDPQIPKIQNLKPSRTKRSHENRHTPVLFSWTTLLLDGKRDDSRYHKTIEDRSDSKQYKRKFFDKWSRHACKFLHMLRIHQNISKTKRGFLPDWFYRKHSHYKIDWRWFTANCHIFRYSILRSLSIVSRKIHWRNIIN